MADDRYKRDLEKLFQPGGHVPDRFKGLMGKVKDDADLDPARAEAIEELRKAPDFRAFNTAVREYRKAGYELPDDEDLLIRMLDLPDERTVQAVLAHVLDLERRRGLARKAPLRNRLTTLRTMSEDPKTAELVAQVAEIV